MTDPPPSVPRIVFSDPVLLLALSMTAVRSLFPLVLVVTMPDGDDRPRLAETAAMVVVMALPFGLPCLWWIRVIRNAFRHGTRTTGEVRRLGNARGAMVLEYEFRHDGASITRTTLSTASSRYRRLREGQQVTVIVDPGQRKRIFVREVYLM